MKQYIMALDQGTSSSRTIIYDGKFNTVAVEQEEFTQYYKNDSWVEHDPMEIWETQLRTAKEPFPNRACPLPTSPQSASPTSAKPQSYGIVKPASPYITPLYGCASAHRITARFSKNRVTAKKIKKKPV